jgi:hypothetical protein
VQFDQLKCREFITLLGGAAVWPLAARAQQAPIPAIGYMSARAPEESAHLLAASAAVWPRRLHRGPESVQDLATRDRMNAHHRV